MKLRTVFILSIVLSAIVCVGILDTQTAVIDNLQYSGTIQSINTTGDGYPDRVTDQSSILHTNDYNVVIEVSHYNESEPLTKTEIERVRSLFESRNMNHANNINLIFVDSGSFKNSAYPNTDVSKLSLQEYEKSVAQEQQYAASGTYHIVITDEVHYSDENQSPNMSGIASGGVALIESNPYTVNNSNSTTLPLRERILAHEIGHLLGIDSSQKYVDSYTDWNTYPSVMNYNLPCQINTPNNCNDTILTFTDHDWTQIELYLSNTDFQVTQFNITHEDELYTSSVSDSESQ